ncbi:MAG: hypothetical protein V4641_31270 [Pseudomonadota bacterium]
MAWAMVGAAAITVVGGAINANQQKKAAQGAQNAQTAAADKGIEEQQRQFDAMQKLLAPYVAGGDQGLSGQKDFLGLNGQAAQKSAVAGIQDSAQFGALAQQGENAILQNASATGGLRGGNTQGALAQFRPNLLSGLIDQQYSRLGGLTQMGQASAAGVGVAGMQSGDAITKLLQQQGAAQAGGALANGAANAQFGNTVVGALGQFMGSKF